MMRFHRNSRTRVFAFFAVCNFGLAQFSVPSDVSIYDRTPHTRAKIDGAKTIAGYQVSADGRTIFGPDSNANKVFMHLPAERRKGVPQLLGMLHRHRNVELFLLRVDLNVQSGEPSHRVEVFRGERGAQASLIHSFTLKGGPGCLLTFFEPPDDRDTSAVLIDMQGGAYWGTTYLLAPDRQSVSRLFDSSDYEFADLDRDGVYELIAWNRRPFDVRCNFGIFYQRYYPEVFVRKGASYQKAWPPASWARASGEIDSRFRRHDKSGIPWGARFQVTAGLADLRGEQTAELIVLQDQLRDAPTQELAVYRLDHTVFRLVSTAALPPPRIAYLLWGVRDSAEGKEILIRTAPPATCRAGGNPAAPETELAIYPWLGGRLRPEIREGR